MTIHLVITSCALAWCTSPGARTTGDTIIARVQLDEVTVFAKETLPREKTPAAISLLPAPRLEREGVRSLKQVMGRVPNFYMPDYGSKLNSPLYIRGIGSRTGAPAVGLYVDGIPYLEATAFDFRLLDVEAIEVARGPRGTLYGRNTLAGIVNVTTRSPLLHPGTTASVRGGSYLLAEAGVSNNTRLDERLGLSTAINYHHVDGHDVNVHDGARAGTRDDLSARARALLLHGARARSALHVALERSRQEGYPYGKIENGKITPVNHDERGSYARDLVTAGYDLALPGDRLSLRAITGYQFLDDRQAADQDFSPAALFFAVQEQRQHALTQELVARPARRGKYTHVTGLFAFAQWLDKTVEVFTRVNDGHALSRYDQFTRGAALYHQSSLEPLPGLTLSAGARLDREIASQEHGNAAGVTSVTLRFFEFLPAASVAYSRRGLTAYLSLAKGYKTGGFNATFSNESERVFDPETSWNHEAGVKLRLPGNATLDAALFYIDWRHQQITQMILLPGGTSGSLVRNAGRSTSKGAELSVTATPLPRLEVDLHYGYTDARFRDYLHDPATGTRYDGNRVPRVPDHTLSAGAACRLPVPRWLDEAILHARYNGTGRIYWQEGNTDGQPYHATLDAGITLAAGRAAFSLRAANVFNARPVVYRFDVAPTRSSFAQRARPFTLDAGINFHF
jgi:outer membrane receptor protein involved in Fe transport